MSHTLLKVGSQNISADRSKILFMIYSEHKKVVPLQKDRWYRVELLQEPSKEDERVNHKAVSFCHLLKLILLI